MKWDSTTAARNGPRFPAMGKCLLGVSRRRGGDRGALSAQSEHSAPRFLGKRQQTRRRVGPDFPIVFRWSQWKQQDYHTKLCPTPAELERFLGPISDAGVDVFDCSTRRFWEPEFQGSSLNLAGWAKKITGKTTMTVGSVGLERSNWNDDGEFSLTDSGLASLDPLIERLEAGEFDLVGVGRMLITNPQWPNQLREGRLEEIRPYSNTHLMTLE